MDVFDALKVREFAVHTRKLKECELVLSSLQVDKTAEIIQKS